MPAATCLLHPRSTPEARLSEPLQATSAQRTETAQEAYGEKKISKGEFRSPAWPELEGPFTFRNSPLPRTECGESGPAARERVLPLCLALPPAFLSSQQPSQNSQQEAKVPN